MNTDSVIFEGKSDYKNAEFSGDNAIALEPQINAPNVDDKETTDERLNERMLGEMDALNDELGDELEEKLDDSSEVNSVDGLRNEKHSEILSDDSPKYDDFNSEIAKFTIESEDSDFDSSPKAIEKNIGSVEFAKESEDWGDDDWGDFDEASEFEKANSSPKDEKSVPPPNPIDQTINKSNYSDIDLTRLTFLRCSTEIFCPTELLSPPIEITFVCQKKPHLSYESLTESVCEKGPSIDEWVMEQLVNEFSVDENCNVQPTDNDYSISQTPLKLDISTSKAENEVSSGSCLKVNFPKIEDDRRSSNANGDSKDEIITNESAQIDPIAESINQMHFDVKHDSNDQKSKAEKHSQFGKLMMAANKAKKALFSIPDSNSPKKSIPIEAPTWDWGALDKTLQKNDCTDDSAGKKDDNLLDSTLASIGLGTGEEMGNIIETEQIEEMPSDFQCVLEQIPDLSFMLEDSKNRANEAKERVYSVEWGEEFVTAKQV
mmetsp:Transcript_20092/g.29695  ORF Transcript_20092/g.29695 Transcript_20092/m.29695 type:complete len:489 (+) Transcript_20092:120-1586(+)